MRPNLPGDNRDQQNVTAEISIGSMTTRISKACHECRARKVRCNGEQPCRHCLTRGTTCEYRIKARNRAKKSDRGSTVASSIADHGHHGLGDGASEYSIDGGTDVERDMNLHSVAAIHHPSPSSLVQLYYGPSSVFALLNSIYRHMESPRSSSPTRGGGVQEMGDSLDLFNHRRLFFGDLGDPRSSLPPNLGVFLDTNTTKAALDKYLKTYWHSLPAMSKEDYQNRLESMLRPPALFDIDSVENIIIVIALSIGVFMQNDTATSEFLYRKAREGLARVDEMVNVKVVQAYLMLAQLQYERACPNSAFLHIGMAARRAIAAGLHKDIGGRAGESQQEADQRRALFWAVYYWETFSSICMGRPSCIADPGDGVQMPRDCRLLCSLIDLSRIISRCVDKIYTQKHASLLPVWKSANEVRSDLCQFAMRLPQTLGFDLGGDIFPGETGVAQAMISNLYYHIMLMAYRPFFLLKAKLRRKYADAEAAGQRPPRLPHWFDRACAYCVEAAKGAITTIAIACRNNEICREVKFHNFFIEVAVYILAFDLMQDRDANVGHLSVIKTAIGTMRLLLPPTDETKSQSATTIAAVERMVQSVFPNYTAEFFASTEESINTTPNIPGFSSSTVPMPSANVMGIHPSEQLRRLALGQSSVSSDDQDDFNPADVGMDFDFGNMDMEAFLSIDPSQDWGFRY